MESRAKSSYSCLVREEPSQIVFDRDIPSLPPREVLIQYRRRALRELIQQVSNGIESDCISFRSVRSASIFQDGGQVLGVLRMTLAILQEPPEHEFTTADAPLLYYGARKKRHKQKRYAFLRDACLCDAFSRDTF